MGCDIHGYIEWGSKYENRIAWDCFGELHIRRNYELFGALAGVRSDLEPPTPPKGAPKDLSFWVKLKNLLYIVEDTELCADDEGCVKRSTAEKWVKSGSSEYNENKTHVSHPDWHTHSWLDLHELKKAKKLYETQFDYGPGSELDAIIAVMESFEKSGKFARFVFWFDN